MATDRIVIIGAGLAGMRAAERLRERGHNGPIEIIGDEPHRPYTRPPLSKQVLSGKMEPADLALRTHGGDLDATWTLGDGVKRLAPQTRSIELASGRHVRYDALIIASGVEARTLPNAPTHLPNVQTLRTLADCRAIDQAMTRADSIAIIGGGFIGCEVATSARKRAITTTIIDISPTLLGHAVGAEVGEIVTGIHRNAGVELRLGRQVTTFEQAGNSLVLHLDDGAIVDADVVVVGVGTRPRVEFLSGLGLDLTDGVLCTPTCHVVGLDDTVAAGDCARWPNLRFDEHPYRVEHWINAVEQARAAADALLDGPFRAEPFAPIPRFWSEQHDVKIQSIGMPRLADRVNLTERDPRSHRTIATYHRGDELVGVIAIDEPRRLLDYTRELSSSIGKPVTALVA